MLYALTNSINSRRKTKLYPIYRYSGLSEAL